MATLTFEDRLQAIIKQLPALIPNQEAYLVSDLFSKFTLYIVNAPHDLAETVQPELADLISEIEIIEADDYIHQDLQTDRTPLEDSKNLYFVNRHIEKSNWYITAEKPSKRQAYTVAFYSFKGGLGRTTSLVLSALHLARQGKRVALIDFDLEAPGLGPLFQPDMPQVATVRGTADFLLDWQASEQQPPALDLASYYFTLNTQDLVGHLGGEVAVFPATYSERQGLSINYIDKLSKINLQYEDSLADNYAPDALLKAIDEQLSPDYIFIDTRTGINDIGGLILQRYADCAFLFFQGNAQNMFGLEALLPKVYSFGMPFFLINSPTPRDPATREQEVEYFLTTSYNTFFNLGYYSGDNPPNIEDNTADHYPINIPYNDTATFLNSTSKLQSLLDENGSENAYLKLAKIIADEADSDIADGSQSLKTEPDASTLVEAMSRIIDQNASSEQEFLLEEDLKRNFYPRSDYRFIFERNKFLILGEKGSGKTALYAVLSHQKYARELAKFCGSSNFEWQRTTWIKGLAKEESRYPSIGNFAALDSLSPNQLRNYWLILLCREVNSEYQDDLLNKSIKTAKFSAIRDLAQSSTLGEELEEYLSEINTQLAKEGKFITVIYDYLDYLLTEENNLRGRLVAALLRLWYEYQSRFPNLRTKIFLRKDIYDREIPSGMTDKVKLDNFKQEIQWELPQLLSMVWKRVIERAPEDGLLFIEEAIGVSDIPNEANLGFIPNFSQEQHARLLEHVFGKRMGSNNKAFPYNWIEQHIADTLKHIQPRSILNLFGLGARKQLTELDYPTTLIRPQNFENVLGDVSSSRVRDLEEEYPHLETVFKNLTEQLRQFPAQESDLKKALEVIKLKDKLLATRDVNDILQELIQVGVLYEYKFNRSVTGIRYHIPDLYLFGLGLVRKGPGAHKNIFDSQRRASRRN